MPRRHRRRSMKGGFWDSLTKAWDDTKKSVSGSTGTTTSAYVPPPPPPSSTTSVGGRKRSRKMRGGYADNMALTGLASSAAPISDIKSAQPQTTVGGRRTKRRCHHRHRKSCKHRR